MIALAAIAAVVLVTGLAAWFSSRVWRTASRAADRREIALLGALERQEDRHNETLDRLMYAAGRPWRQATEPAEAEELDGPDEWPDVLEDPIAGAAYPDLFEPFATNGVHVEPGDEFDTADLDREIV